MQMSNIADMIHLAVAPVFLLTGVGTMLGVLINRLARIVDRTRKVEDAAGDGADRAMALELRILYRRSRLISYGVTLATACGLQVCLVIMMLFVGDTADLQLQSLIAGFFIGAMLCLIGTFICLLFEILAASRHMRVRQIAALEKNPA